MRSCVFLAALLSAAALVEPAAAAETGAGAPVTAGAPSSPGSPTSAASVGEAPKVTIINPTADPPAAAGSAPAPAPPANSSSATNPDTAAAAAVPNTATTPAEAGPAPTPSVAEADAAAQPPAPPPEPTLVIDIDLSRQAMVVAENGEETHRWRVSTARYGYRTPTGTYQPTWMSKMWYSRQYDYAPMPHAIFFHQGVAIHGSYAIGALGRPASHGCVRLAPRNAALLYTLVGRHGKERTQIVVHGRPDHSSSQVAADRSDRDEATPIRRSSSYYYDYPSPSRRATAYRAYGYGNSYGFAPRDRRAYAPPRRYAPRGLYSGYSYGYGF